jgi:hypothetical protein
MEWQPLAQEILTAGSDAQADGSFGGPLLGSHQGVSMDGRLLIVGSPGADVGNLDAAGKAYIFLYDQAAAQWSLEATLKSNAPQTAGHFGQAVAISGTRVVVGEYSANKAHIFNRDPITHHWNPDGSPLSQTGAFGWSVALHGDVAVVGANDAEKAYVYNRVSGAWQPSASGPLTTGDSLADDFGSCVSIDGSLVLVGARASTHPVTNQAFIGAAYLFQRQNLGGQEQWQEVLRIRSGIAPYNDGGCTHGNPDRFGETVLLKGDTGFIGANADELPEVAQTYGLAGLVYILDKLPAPDDCVQPGECPP